LAHPQFRRASCIERELWIGLILLADDEGRVRLDMVALAESIFSPMTHKVNERKVREALDFWATPHNGSRLPWLMIYDDGQYGFLTGWYEHQWIAKETREESSLPAPPLPVNSWAVADAVYGWYCREKGQKKTFYRLAIRALLQLTVAQQEEIVAQELRNCHTTVAQQLRVEGKGREGKGNEGKGREEEVAPMGAPDAPPLDPQPDLCAEAHDPVIQAARSYFTDPNPPLLPHQQAQSYGRECRGQLQGNSDFTDAQIVQAFATNGPRSGKERRFPDAWFERLRRERDGPPGKREPPRNDPQVDWAAVKAEDDARKEALASAGSS